MSEVDYFIHESSYVDSNVKIGGVQKFAFFSSAIWLFNWKKLYNRSEKCKYQ